MRTPQTQKAIAKEIAKLEHQRPFIRPSAFGEDNQAALDAQIRTLRAPFDETEVYEKFDRPAEGDELTGSEQNILDSALEALWWRLGHEPTSPSQSWEPLVKRAQGKFK